MQPLNEISTHALAYLGDCVFECCVREYLVGKGLGTSAALNREALEFVRASAQAEAMKRILPILTEEEEGIFKRGRNCGHINLPKHAKMVDYRIATGFEALLGYLYLSGDESRALKLLDIAVTMPDEAKDI